MNEVTLAVAAKVIFSSGILRFLTPGLKDEHFHLWKEEKVDSPCGPNKGGKTGGKGWSISVELAEYAWICNLEFYQPRNPILYTLNMSWFCTLSIHPDMNTYVFVQFCTLESLLYTHHSNLREVLKVKFCLRNVLVGQLQIQIQYKYKYKYKYTHHSNQPGSTQSQILSEKHVCRIVAVQPAWSSSPRSKPE